MADGRRGNVVVWTVAAVLAAVVVWHVAGSGRGGDAASSAVRINPGSPPAGAQPSEQGSSAGIYVHVAGAVRRPGLIRVPAGSRVALAVDRAGGPTRKADLAGVNLAARLEDGQQVLVPVAGTAAAGAAAPGATAGTGSASGGAGTAGAVKLSLGTATVEQLDQLDGFGPTLAQRIVDYRTKHGGFRSIGELREVEGIGEKRFESLRDALQP
jgi:competence protein ComEA